MGRGVFRMSIVRLKRLWRSVEELFPERHLYVRSGGEMRGYVLSTSKQLMGAGAVRFISETIDTGNLAPNAAQPAAGGSF